MKRSRRQNRVGLAALDVAKLALQNVEKADPEEDDDEDDEDAETCGDSDEECDDDEEESCDKPKEKAASKKFVLSQKNLNARDLGYIRLDAAGGTISLFDVGGSSVAPQFDDATKAKKWLEKDLGLDASDAGDFFARVVDSVRSDNNANFNATEADYKLIRPWLKRDFELSELKVYNTYSADTLLDRKYHHFAPEALKDMADKTAGNPTMDGHWWYGPEAIFGKLFEGKVAKSSVSGLYLFQRFFILDRPEYRQLCDGFESGINDKLSVGIRINLKYFVCDLCNKSWVDGCNHYPGDEYIDTKGKVQICTFTIQRVAQFIELSRVGVPAQPMAHVKGMTYSDSGRKSKRSNFSKSDAALINGDSTLNKEDSAVNEAEKKQAEEAAKKAAEDAATKAADEAAKKAAEAKATAPGIDDVVKVMSEGVSKSVTDAISKQVADSLAPLTEANKTLLDTLSKVSKALDERDAASEKAINENREALKGCIELHIKLAEKVDASCAKSLEELKRYFTSDQAKSAGAEAPKETKAVDTGAFFSGMISEMINKKK